MTREEFRLTLKRLGLSQAQAASLFGVQVRSVERWLSGERDISPTAIRFLRLYAALLRAGWSREAIDAIIQA